MIDREKTFLLFGYYPDKFAKTSQRKVVSICKECNSERITGFRHGNKICLKCSGKNNIIKAQDVIRVPIEIRFENFVIKGELEEDCWGWKGYIDPNGYARIHYKDRQHTAYTISWILRNGPIAENLQIDHTCRNHVCTNPLHLEPVTQKENILRGIGFSAVNARKTHCPQGHEYNEINTSYDKFGWRSCKVCHRDKERNRQQNKRILCGI